MPRAEKISKDVMPRYFELLTEEDQEAYTKLREQLSSPNCKNRRNKSNEVFKDIVKSIKRFSVKNDENDWKRSLVCGVIWLTNSIAINTHQLRLLITKCKSSINGSFQALGYGTVPTGTDSAGELISKFPFLRNNFAELRQWTVRQKVNQPKNSSSNNSSNSMSSSPSIDIKSENSPLIDRITISSNVTHTNKSKNAQSVTVGNAVKTTSNQNSQSLFEKISSASIPARLSNSLATSLSTGLSASLFSTLTLSLDDLKTSRDLSDPITPPPDLIPLSSTDFGFDFTENEQFKSIEEYDIIPSVVFSEDPLMFFPPTDDKASLDFFDLGDRI